MPDGDHVLCYKYQKNEQTLIEFQNFLTIQTTRLTISRCLYQKTFVVVSVPCFPLAHRSPIKEQTYLWIQQCVVCGFLSLPTVITTANKVSRITPATMLLPRLPVTNARSGGTLMMPKLRLVRKLQSLVQTKPISGSIRVDHLAHLGTVFHDLTT